MVIVRAHVWERRLEARVDFVDYSDTFLPNQAFDRLVRSVPLLELVVVDLTNDVTSLGYLIGAVNFFVDLRDVVSLS